MYSQKISVERIHVTIATELLKQVDELANHDYTTRSDVLRAALLEYIRGSELG